MLRGSGHLGRQPSGVGRGVEMSEAHGESAGERGGGWVSPLWCPSLGGGMELVGCWKDSNEVDDGLLRYAGKVWPRHDRSPRFRAVGDGSIGSKMLYQIHN